jgi:hypothetical protein
MLTMFICFPYNTPDLSECLYNTGIKQESTRCDVAASQVVSAMFNYRCENWTVNLLLCTRQRHQVTIIRQGGTQNLLWSLRIFPLAPSFSAQKQGCRNSIGDFSRFLLANTNTLAREDGIAFGELFHMASPPSRSQISRQSRQRLS